MAHWRTEAFSRVKVDALLRDVGWNMTDGRSVRFEYVLSDGTKADYVLCDRLAGQRPWLRPSEPRSTHGKPRGRRPLTPGNFKCRSSS